MSHRTQLRNLLQSGRLIVAPGAFDCLTAKLIEQAGFPAVYMTGGGTSASLGYPDYGLVTMTEMAGNAARISGSVQVPVIADCDTGYGSEINLFRAVEEYERAGVAAVQIEDQVFPKRCGHLDGKELVETDEFLAKIRAAVAARRDPDLVIVARTDARAVSGLDAAIERANAALAVGADVAFVEALETLDEVRQVPKAVNGPCLLNVVRGGKTPEVDLAEVERMGYAIAIVPGLLLAGVMGICDQLLADLQRLGRHPRPPGDLSIPEMFSRLGSAEWDLRRRVYRSGGDAAAAAATARA